MTNLDDKIRTEIQRGAKELVKDNIKNPSLSDYLLIETAMLIGSSIALENLAKENLSND